MVSVENVLRDTYRKCEELMANDLNVCMKLTIDLVLDGVEWI